MWSDITIEERPTIDLVEPTVELSCIIFLDNTTSAGERPGPICGPAPRPFHVAALSSITLADHIASRTNWLIATENACRLVQLIRRRIERYKSQRSTVLSTGVAFGTTYMLGPAMVDRLFAEYAHVNCAHQSLRTYRGISKINPEHGRRTQRCYVVPVQPGLNEVSANNVAWQARRWIVKHVDGLQRDRNARSYQDHKAYGAYRAAYPELHVSGEAFYELVRVARQQCWRSHRLPYHGGASRTNSMRV